LQSIAQIKYMDNEKPILGLDFDGVIHSYKSGWKGADQIPDDIVDGFFEWAEQAAKYFRLVVYSSRSHQKNAIPAMNFWLIEQRRKWRERGGMHSIDDPLPIEFSDTKPQARVSIDDRVICFHGDWSAPELKPEVLSSFKPWNRK
jgi:hypothetical protein